MTKAVSVQNSDAFVREFEIVIRWTVGTVWLFMWRLAHDFCIYLVRAYAHHRQEIFCPKGGAGSRKQKFLVSVFLDINRKHADITETSKNSVRTYGFRSEPSLLVSVFKEDSCKYAFSVTYSLSFVGPPSADRCFPKFPFSRGCLGLQHR
jgi:hypothetical protein